MSVFSFGWMRGRRLAYDYDGSFCLFFFSLCFVFLFLLVAVRDLPSQVGHAGRQAGIGEYFFSWYGLTVSCVE